MITRPSRFPPMTRVAALASLLVIAGYLGGCAGMGDSFVSGAFVDPAKYGQYDCQQLEGERKSLAARTAEYQGLIDKAQTGTAGTVVGELAYRNEYISIRASAKLADEAWVQNKCVATAPPAPPAAAPAPKPPSRRAR